VWAVEVSPDGSKVAVGGAFEVLNGTSSFGKGFAVVDAVTGEILPHAATSLIRNGGSNSAVTSLDTDGELLYGTGYHFGAGGTLEGSFASTWDDGTVVWINNCHGDALNIHADGDVIYSVGHAHHCGDIDGFGQRDGSDGAWDEYRALATTREVAGQVTTNRYGGTYTDFGGNPRPDLLNWFPAVSNGVATRGRSTGRGTSRVTTATSCSAASSHRVNFQNQQGLVRFARRDFAPNAQGPYLFNATFPIRVQSFWDGTVTISWPGNVDRDDATLDYRVFRRAIGSGGGGQQLHQRVVTAPFWALPRMNYTDEGGGAGFEYRVQVRDDTNSIANSLWTQVTTVGGGSDYLATVLESQPDSLWRLGEQPGAGTAADLIGFRDATVPSAGVTFGQPGAIANDPDTAAQFAGTSNNHFIRTGAREHPPQIFSLEAWIRATGTTNGGLIVGFNRSVSGDGDTAPTTVTCTWTPAGGCTSRSTRPTP
jgi:hypothetical protein